MSRTEEHSSEIGMDISYPQCGSKLPDEPAFGIIGVNGGRSSNFNACFPSEFIWGMNSVGGVYQPRVALYLNTANPGEVISQVDDWPTSSRWSNPYNIDGVCTGGNNAACAWQYGYNHAKADMLFVGVSAGGEAGRFRYWLDVETANSWTGNTRFNQAELEGMVKAITQAGGRVGLYSTSTQWATIAGEVYPGSSLYGLPEWRPGAADLDTAKANCSLAPFTGGGYVTLTQYTPAELDYNYSCNDWGYDYDDRGDHRF